MFIRSFVVCVLIISAFVGCTFGAEYMETKQDFIKTCQRKDPDDVFVPCSTESIQLLFQQLTTGIEGFETRIDPIKLRKIKIFSSEGPVSLNTSLSNALITGLGQTTVVRSNLSPVDYSWDANIRVLKLRLEGEYDMNGRILLLPLQGRGKCWIEPQNMDIIVKAKANLYEKFGHIFYNITELLEDSTNAFLNDNWKPVSEAFKPLIKQTIQDIVVEKINKVFNFMPVEYLVSDIPHPSELYRDKESNEKIKK